MASTATEKRKYTYEDYLKTPDDVRYELIEGELLMTPSPETRHQRISGKIVFALEKFVTENDLGEVFHAPCDVHLNNDVGDNLNNPYKNKRKGIFRQGQGVSL